MTDLTYSPVQPYEIQNLQAMSQGEGLGAIDFGNTKHIATIVIHHGFQPVGFISGYKTYVDACPALKITEKFLCASFKDSVDQQELELALINLAKEDLHLEHYLLPNSTELHPIGIESVIPQMPVHIKQDEQNLPAQEFSFS